MGAVSFLSSLSNKALLDETKRLAGNERGSTAALIAALSEVDRRGLYLDEGYSCMFYYCTKTLLLSEPCAYLRIEVARLSRLFPEIIEHIATGALTLTTTALIAPLLTLQNAQELIASISFKTKREVERLIAERNPKPDVPTVVRKQPATATCVRSPLVAAIPEPSAPTPPQPAREPAPPPPDLLVPLSAATYKIQFTADQDTHDKLRHAQSLLRHQIPAGDLASIINRALTLLIADVERKKLGRVAKPKGSAKLVASDSRHIPAAVRRAVADRDKGQCAFVGTQGRCSERGFLEFHHVVPFAAGGIATADNIELRCRAHNAHEAVLYFGEDVARDARRESG
jgi:hypothetical protein